MITTTIAPKKGYTVKIYRAHIARLTTGGFDTETNQRSIVTAGRGEPFTSEQREAYSRFKYGWLPPAITYAEQLAVIIAEDLWRVSAGRPIYIVSAPYKFLPTASHAIAQKLCDILSFQAYERGLEPPVLLPLHKAQAGDSSYAKGSTALRTATLANLGLHIDESLIPDSIVLVVDDIRITGTAEIATADYLEPLKPYAIWYLHAYRLDEVTAQANPELEDHLNETVEHSLAGFLHQKAAGEYQLNTRALRHILEAAEYKFFIFIRMAPTELLDEILRAAIGTGVDYTSRYPEKMDLLITERQRRDRGVPKEDLPPAPSS